MIRCFLLDSAFVALPYLVRHSRQVTLLALCRDTPTLMSVHPLGFCETELFGMRRVIFGLQTAVHEWLESLSEELCPEVGSG